jgi:ribonuclease Z
MNRIFVSLICLSLLLVSVHSFAAGGKVTSPTAAAPDRYVYYPGTEELGPDEMRVLACGTGMPSARHGQAATCFLVELGNGDKFFFDIGAHSMGNVASLMIPYDYLDKIFISHLHTDHWGDLASLWAGGWTAGRTSPLKIWGPSGAVPEMGTKYAVEHFMKAYNWDYQTRLGALADEPGQIRVTEFDYKGVSGGTVFLISGLLNMPKTPIWLSTSVSICRSRWLRCTTKLPRLRFTWLPRSIPRPRLLARS